MLYARSIVPRGYQSELYETLSDFFLEIVVLGLRSWAAMDGVDADYVGSCGVCG